MDTLATLREMRDQYHKEWTELRHGDYLQESNTPADKADALEQAIAIITEADALLPVLQQMAHSMALGEAGDAALKRLISLLSTEEV